MWCYCDTVAGTCRLGTVLTCKDCTYLKTTVLFHFSSADCSCLRVVLCSVAGQHLVRSVAEAIHKNDVGVRCAYVR
jgi:hypothetical protein